jgi:hypothetical protein
VDPPTGVFDERSMPVSYRLLSLGPPGPAAVDVTGASYATEWVTMDPRVAVVDRDAVPTARRRGRCLVAARPAGGGAAFARVEVAALLTTSVTTAALATVREPEGGAAGEPGPVVLEQAPVSGWFVVPGMRVPARWRAGVKRMRISGSGATGREVAFHMGKTGDVEIDFDVDGYPPNATLDLDVEVESTDREGRVRRAKVRCVLHTPDWPTIPIAGITVDRENRPLGGAVVQVGESFPSGETRPVGRPMTSVGSSTSASTRRWFATSSSSTPPAPRSPSWATASADGSRRRPISMA